MKPGDLEAIARAIGPIITARLKQVEDQVLSLVASLEQRIANIPAPKDGEPGPIGEKGDPGENGRDGTSVLPGDVLPTVRSWVDEFMAAIRAPQDGKDGRDGKDGKDGAAVTVDDVRPLIEAELARWQVEFERRAQDVLQRAIDRIPAPKDGKDGSPGRDALQVEDFELALADDERTLSVALVCGAVRVERQIRLSHPIHRGVYQPGSSYLKGDCVTYGGSTWSATRDTASKPETDDSWRLIVKRGRDGKDGQKGERGEPGRSVKQMHAVP